MSHGSSSNQLLHHGGHMKKRISGIIIAICICLSFPVFAQGTEDNTSVLSIKTIMNFESEAIKGEILKTIQMKDGSFVGVGSTTDGTNKLSYMEKRTQGDKESTALVFKFNADGSLAFLKTFGGQRNDRFNDVILTSDGGFIASGYTSSVYEGDYKNYNISCVDSGTAMLIKYDSNGNIEWVKTGIQKNIYYYTKVSENDNGDISVVGGGYIIQYDKHGSELSAIEYFASQQFLSNEIVNCVQITDNGEVYFCGTESFENNVTCGFLGKLDNSGNTIFKKSFTVNGKIDFKEIILSSDHNIIITATYVAVAEGVDASSFDVKLKDKRGCAIIAFQQDGTYKNSSCISCPIDMETNTAQWLVSLDDGDVLIQYSTALGASFTDCISNKVVEVDNRSVFVYRVDSSANFKYLYRITPKDASIEFFRIYQFEQLTDGTFRIFCAENFSSSITRIFDVVDKFELEQTINSVQNKNSDEYTSDTWSAFENALNSAIAVNKSTSTTQNTVDSTTTALKNASVKLVQGNNSTSENSVTNEDSDFSTSETESNEDSELLLSSVESDTSVPSRNSTDQTNSESVSQESENENGNSGTVIIIIVSVVVLAAGIGVYFYLKRKKKV